MSDKKFVQLIIPTAICSLVDDLEEKRYVIYALDGHEREYVVGYSVVNEEDAWKQVAETFRQKMLLQLEAV